MHSDSCSCHLRRGIAVVARGFSLIELLVVLAIAGVLAMVAYPGYRDSVTRTRRAEGRAALAALMLEQERRFTATGSYQAFSATAPNGLRWYSGATPQDSAYELSGMTCSTGTLRDCVLLSATPGTDRVHGGHRDPVCGQLTLDSQGARRAGGPGPGCW